MVPEMQQALDRVLRAKRFDIVNLEFTFLGHCDLRQAPPGEQPPVLIVDSHNIDYDIEYDVVVCWPQMLLCPAPDRRVRYDVC